MSTVNDSCTTKVPVPHGTSLFYSVKIRTKSCWLSLKVNNYSWYLYHTFLNGPVTRKVVVIEKESERRDTVPTVVVFIKTALFKINF